MAGDGYVLARFAQAAGLEVSVISAVPVGTLKGDARQAHADFAASGGTVQALSSSLLREGELIVDAGVWGPA
ncbi:MAG: NAD(P)H-hydrate epimerase [Steroidobacteraceae bacterium]